MKKIIRILMVASLLCLGYSGNVLADINTGCANGIYWCDYGNAPGYGTAANASGWWQRLGRSWSAESSSNYGYNASNDGVSWSVDGGLTYGLAALTAGQTVIFKFDVFRSPYGGHQYDQLAAWIDWNGNKIWESNELIIAEQWFKTGDGYPDITYAEYLAFINDPNYDSAIIEKYFTVSLMVPEDAVSTWLRARVDCTDVPFGSFTPYVEVYQGETEDYSLLIKVPETDSVVLLGFGLLCIALMRRKIKISAR